MHYQRIYNYSFLIESAEIVIVQIECDANSEDDDNLTENVTDTKRELWQ